MSDDHESSAVYWYAWTTITYRCMTADGSQKDLSDAGHHRHLDVAGNAQFRLDTLLGGFNLSQALGGTTAVQGVYYKE